jgi:hypothetical protein
MLRRSPISAGRAIVFPSLLALACGPFLQAQNSVSTGVINGQVVDFSGAAVAGADVLIINSSNGYKQVRASSEGGLFSFPGVPVGSYALDASASGFRGVHITDVNAMVGQTTAITVKMERGDVKQDVQVTAGAELLHTSDPSISPVIDQTMVQNLPTLRRRYTDFALLGAGVTVEGQFGSVSFAGSRGDYTSNYAGGSVGSSFSVDGANSTSWCLSEQRMETRAPYVFRLESVEEFQVSINPYSPAYGGSAAIYRF